MKKIDFKKINWKDPKIIFPLVLLLPVLFLGWMIFGIIGDMSSETPDEEVKQEVADVPLGDSTAISSKEAALMEVFRQEQDYTALQLANESTRLDADTTIYTEEERKALALEEEEQRAYEESIKRTNQRIQEQNQQLAEQRRALSGSPYSVEEEESSRSKDLDREIMMYQKLLRGEEILTPEQEQEKKINQARQEERQRIMSELSKKESVIVEKVTSLGNNTSVFNTLAKKESENSYIRAMVDQGVTVTTGSRIRFRLLDDIKIQGTLVPSGSHVYALVSEFGEQRVKAIVSSIVTRGKRVKVNLSVYDRDGIEGFFIPKSSFRDFSREAGSQAIGSSNININNTAESIEGVALQALQGVYQSASTAISSKIRENKAKIKYNTTIYLINDNE